VDTSVVNFIRRTILGEIPNVAISFDINEHYHTSVNFALNTCALHNEYLAHRLSLLPICLTPSEIDEFDEDEFEFSIIKKNNTLVPMEVTTKDIVIHVGGEKMSEDFRERLFPKDPFTQDYILITKLRNNPTNQAEGDELSFIARASKGIPRRNACWSCVSLCTYGNVVEKAQADIAFAEIIEKKGLKGPEAVMQERRVFDAMDAKRYYYKNSRGEPSKFIFKLESECAMTPRYLVTKALRVMIEKCEALSSSIEGRDSKIITANQDDNGMVNITVIGETHSLGNLLQAHLYNTRVLDNIFEFVGYTVPHPLEESFVLRMKAIPDKGRLTVESALSVVATVCKELVRVATSLSEEWTALPTAM
jgi:DNA-directed RNA polymerase subunit L